MIRIILLLNRLGTVTPEDFRLHYETVHVPLAFELFPMMSWHRRNYPQPVPLTALADPGVDCVTEIAFNDEAAFERFLEARRDPEIVRRLRTDEALFLDSSRTRWSVSDARLTPDIADRNLGG